eukprot:3922866-Prymnesium_polylepis.1
MDTQAQQVLEEYESCSVKAHRLCGILGVLAVSGVCTVHSTRFRGTPYEYEEKSVAVGSGRRPEYVAVTALNYSFAVSDGAEHSFAHLAGGAVGRALSCHRRKRLLTDIRHSATSSSMDGRSESTAKAPSP